MGNKSQAGTQSWQPGAGAMGGPMGRPVPLSPLSMAPPQVQAQPDANTLQTAQPTAPQSVQMPLAQAPQQAQQQMMPRKPGLEVLAQMFGANMGTPDPRVAAFRQRMTSPQMMNAGGMMGLVARMMAARRAGGY